MAEAQDLSRLGFRGESADIETVRMHKDGVRVHVSIVSGPVSVEGSRIAQYIIYRDITERKRAEQRLRDSEAYLAEALASEAVISLENARAGAALRELESNFAHMNRVSMMGELAASLAHEIMQPIATVRNNARAALNFLDKDPPNLAEVREALGCVVDDADRAGHTVGRIRDQIRRAPMRKDQFDLNAAIREMIVLELTVGRGDSRFGRLRRPRTVARARSRRQSHAPHGPSRHSHHLAPDVGFCCPRTRPAFARKPGVSKGQRRVLWGSCNMLFLQWLRLFVTSRRTCHGDHPILSSRPRALRQMMSRHDHFFP